MDLLEQRGSNDGVRKGGIALGRITRVNPEKRYCEVKIFMGEPHLLDRSIRNCQWLSLDANPAGDETASIPRAGSMGLVFFVQGEAYIFGYLKPTTKSGGATTGKEPQSLNEGDKVISTVGGNRIVVKGSGVIEIYSSDSLKTVYFPKGGILSQVCEEMQNRCDGGYEVWKTTNNAIQSTLWTKEFRKDLARTCLVYEEIGYVDENIVKRVTVGPGIGGAVGVAVVMYEYTMDITGKKVEKFGLKPMLTTTSSPLGDWQVKNDLGEINLSEKGDWNIKTPAASIDLTYEGDFKLKGPTASLDLTSKGDLNFKGPTCTIDATAQGDMTLKGPTCTLSMNAKGEMEMKGPVGALKIDATGKVALGNSIAELLDVLSQLIDGMMNQTQVTLSSTGPTGPFMPPLLTTLGKLKALMTGLKGSL